MAGSITETIYQNKGLYEVRVVWTCDASGDVSVALSGETMSTIVGKDIVAVVTIPGSGDDAPTASYDAYIKDADSIDLLGNAAMNRSATAGEIVVPYTGAVYGSSPIYGDLTVVVANAGEVKKGTIKILCREGEQ